MTGLTSCISDPKARLVELFETLRDAARPEGSFESFAVHRLAVARWHYERSTLLAAQTVQSPAESDKHGKALLRWESSYNRAYRELRALQTARALANPSTPPPPMADLLQLQRFAKRTGPAAAAAPTSPSPAKSTLCETNAPVTVGRNSPCPCGSGKKFKRCCGVGAAPLLNHAA